RIERSVRPERRHERHEIGRLHRVEPGPRDRPGPPIDGSEQVPPLVLKLEPLADLDPAPTPNPPGRPAQPKAHLVSVTDPAGAGQADRVEGDREPPFFHRACANWSVFSWMGRGTFGAHRSRWSSAYIPPSV